MSSTLLHLAWTTQKPQKAKLSIQMCRGPQTSISFRCRDFVVMWKKFWNNNYLFEVALLQHFLHLRKFSRAVRKAFTGHVLCTPALPGACFFWVYISYVIDWVSKVKSGKLLQEVWKFIFQIAYEPCSCKVSAITMWQVR